MTTAMYAYGDSMAPLIAALTDSDTSNNANTTSNLFMSSDTLPAVENQEDLASEFAA